MISTHNIALSAMTAALSFVAALVFLRFFRRTRDPLFLLFSISFALQSVSRVLFIWTTTSPNFDEAQDREGTNTWFYALRLLAYGLILFAIVQKNRSRPRRVKTPSDPLNANP